MADRKYWWCPRGHSCYGQGPYTHDFVEPKEAQPKCIVCGTEADNWRHVPSIIYGDLPAHEFVTTVRVTGLSRGPTRTFEPAREVRSVLTCEMGPSAVASAPARQRDTFADLCSEWDLLPDVR